MATVAGIRYVALKPLPLQDERGERLVLSPGEEVPAVLHGRWVDVAIEAGKVVAEVAPTDGDGRGQGVPSALAASALTDDELAATLRARGYRVTKARKP